MDIIRVIQNTGRFIAWRGDKWVSVSDETARQKTAHAFQYHIRNLLSKSAGSPHSILNSNDLGAVLRNDAMVGTLAVAARKRNYDHDHKNISTLLDHTIDPLPYRYFDIGMSALGSVSTPSTRNSDEHKSVLPQANSLDVSRCSAFDKPDPFFLDSNNDGNNNESTYPFIKIPHGHSLKLDTASNIEAVTCYTGIPDAGNILDSDNTKQPSQKLKPPPIAPIVNFHD
jgi:hypothetical protein